MKRKHTITLALALDDGPPTAFRLFAAGENVTTKGTFIFDAAAARSVMAAYRAHGVDVALDLEHQSLDGTPTHDPNARDARGWGQLEVRRGELWMVNVKWTTDGAARLREKRQRYCSPAFEADSKKRITKIINVAITALPATHNTPALVAAAERETHMDPKKKKTPSKPHTSLATTEPATDDGDTTATTEQIQKALDAIAAGDTEGATAILEELKAKIGDGAGADDPPADPGAPPPEAPPMAAAVRRLLAMLSGMTPGDRAKVQAAVIKALGLKPDASREEVQAALDAAYGVTAPGDGGGGDPAAAEMMRLTGTRTLGGTLAELHTLMKQRQELQAERDERDSAERRQLCGRLVTHGGHAPAAVWADLAAKVGKPFLQRMSIVELRDHVAEQERIGGPMRKLMSGGALPPAGDADRNGDRTFETPHGVYTMSASELAKCTERGIDPAKQAATRAHIASRGHQGA